MFCLFKKKTTKDGIGSSLSYYFKEANKAIDSLSDEYETTTDVQDRHFHVKHTPSGYSTSARADNAQDFWLGVVLAIERAKAIVEGLNGAPYQLSMGRW